MKDYNDLVRRSIKQDFANANYKRNTRAPKVHKRTKRVKELTEQSGYYKFRKLIVGKLVKIVGPGIVCGVWVEFVHDADRDALNRAGGWTDKRRFLLDGARFDE